ncbi:hypothetical protein HA466_0049840 [Hirschfeldia incana]|nr:hypothetical protein HA466_0049840 [Hirschfeldia incana]
MAETLDALIDNSQETDYSSYAHPEEEEDNNNNNIDLSLLRINSFGNSSDRRRRENSSPPQQHGSSTAASPVKRPSPESKDADDEPRRKKLFLDDETMSNRMGYSKIPLPMDSNPTRVRSSPIYKRSLSDTFSSRRSRVVQETAPSLPPRPPVFRRCVSDVSAAPRQAFRHGPSRSADFENQETSEADKMLYAIKNGVVELDQWCNKLLQYGEPVSSVKQDDIDPKRLIKEGVSELDQWCNKLIKYGDNSPKAEVEEEQDKECKEGVKVDRVGEAFVVEINCPCGRNYRTLFSGRDCYYKLL